MAKSKLEILVTAQTDSAVKALGKVGTASKNVGGETEKLGGKMTLLDGAMLAVGGMATNMAMNLLKSIPQMVELGIEAERAELALKGYAGSSEAAAQYTDAVRDAAGGAISKMDAMQNASRLLAMGLATSKDEAAKLTEIAITLGASMGKGPKQAFEEFTLMLANQSIPRLDTFGISAGKVRERMAELAEENAGMDRQTRFMIATMEDAEGKLLQLEEAGFEATNSLDRLKAEASDLKVEFATTVADGVLPMIDHIYELREATQSAHEEAFKATDTYEEYKNMLFELQGGSANLWNSTEDLTESEYNLSKAIEYGTGTMEGRAAGFLDLAVVMEQAEEDIRNYKTELDALSVLVDNKVGKAYDKFRDKQLTQIEIIGNLKDELFILNEEFAGTDEQVEGINAITAKLAEEEQKLIELEAQYDQQTNKMIFNMAAQRAAVDGNVDAMELKLLQGLAETFGLIDDKQVAVTLGIENAFRILAAPGGGVDAATQALLGTAAAVDSIPNYKQVDIVVNVSQVGANLAAITGGYGGGTYQHGGSFLVGGQGVDQTPVAFMATRGERVTITPPGAKSSGGRNIIINFSGPVYGDQHELERVILPIVEKGIRADQARQ